MADDDREISALPAAATLGGSELVPGTQLGANVKIAIDQIRTYAPKGLPASPARVRSVQERLQEGISVSEFAGFVGNGINDDHPPMQAAIDEAIGLQQAGYGVYRVTVPPATCAISEPLLLMAYNGSAYAPFSVALSSDARGYQYGLSTEIVKTFKDNPGIIIQNGRSVRISGIGVRGIASSSPPTYEQLLKDSVSPWWNTNAARDERWSPDCGIHIDPFSTGGVPADGGYPGFSSYYNASGGSLGVVLEDVGCNKNIVGIAIGLAPATFQGESINIIRADLSQNKVCVAVGQNQSRGNSIDDAHVIGCQVFIDTMRYGADNGIVPTVNRGVVVFGKWLLLENSSIHATINQLYGEAIWSLGVFSWGGADEGMEWNGCKIALIIPEESNLPAIDSQGHFGGPVAFRGGYIGQPDNNYRRQSFYNLSSMTFDDITFDGEPVLFRSRYARFRKLLLKWSGGGRIYGIADRITPTDSTDHEIYDVRAAPFAEIGLTAGSKRYNAGYQDIVIDTAAITVHATNGSATLTAPNAARLQVGDFLISTTAWNCEKPSADLSATSYQGLSIGRVFSIVGTTVTLKGVPVSFPSGTHDLIISRLPIIRPATTGTTTNTSLDITLVSPIASWVVGDRISGAGIPSGSWVTAKSGTTLTISIAATASASGVALYDALLT